MSNRVAIDNVAKLFNGELVSVEILPGGLDDWQTIEIPSDSPRPSNHLPCVLVEGNLGIPKKVAQQLYLTAIALPWRSLLEPDTSVIATTLILIINPAHQTALNVRKRLVKSGYIHPQKELRYLELLLRGLNHCTKQSILWDHRRWCLTQVHGRIGQITSPCPTLEHFASDDEAQFFPNMGSDEIRKEIGIVYHTCESYPRNYYAWNYLHWLINGTFSSFHRHNETRRKDFLGVLIDVYAELRVWVECHPCDYSAVHQLCQIQTIMDHLRVAGVLTKDVGEGRVSHLPPAGHCLSLLSSFPSHESLWMYLRLALMDEPQSHILDRVESNFNSNLHAAKLLAWCRRGRD